MHTIIKDLYDYDEENQSFVIKLSPEKYVDIFNKLDNYPMKKRDINQNVIDYIEDCSSDIPLAQKITIEIKIKNEGRNEDFETRAVKGIKNYFSYILDMHKQNSREVINTSLLYVLVFIILTTVTFGLEAMNININTIFFRTILEGLSIGSWIFLWEAIAGLVIRNKKNRFLIRTYKRLLKSSLVFIYN